MLCCHCRVYHWLRSLDLADRNSVTQPCPDAKLTGREAWAHLEADLIVEGSVLLDAGANTCHTAQSGRPQQRDPTLPRSQTMRQRCMR